MATIIRCDFCNKEVKPEDRRLWQFGEPIGEYPPYTHYYDVCGKCLPIIKIEAQQMIEYLQRKISEWSEEWPT